MFRLEQVTRWDVKLLRSIATGSEQQQQQERQQQQHHRQWATTSATSASGLAGHKSVGLAHIWQLSELDMWIWCLQLEWKNLAIPGRAGQVCRQGAKLNKWRRVRVTRFISRLTIGQRHQHQHQQLKLKLKLNSKLDAEWASLYWSFQLGPLVGGLHFSNGPVVRGPICRQDTTELGGCE